MCSLFLWTSPLTWTPPTHTAHNGPYDPQTRTLVHGGTGELIGTFPNCSVSSLPFVGTEMFQNILLY